MEDLNSNSERNIFNFGLSEFMDKFCYNQFGNDMHFKYLSSWGLL